MSVNRVELEPAYILHARAYRETSQILEVFTPGHGRLTLVAKGARRPKSPLRGILNPFQSLRLSWSGRGEMQTLREAELTGPVTDTHHSAVLSCFYINELILKLLERSDPHPDLFAHYNSLLNDIKTDQPVEPLLRIFELRLLSEIGYEPNFTEEADTGLTVEDDGLYEFVADFGIVRSGRDPDQQGSLVISGSSLRAIARHELADKHVIQEAKQLLRVILNTHLGNRALHTRRVAAAMKRPG